MGEGDARPALPGRWWYVDEALASPLEGQLAREVMPGHRVEGRPLKAIAKCNRNDDVLFVEHRPGEAPTRWLIHLTWSRPADARWPDAAIVRVPDGLRSPFDDA